jgi:acid phosphatase type 7
MRKILLAIFVLLAASSLCVAACATASAPSNPAAGSTLVERVVGGEASAPVEEPAGDEADEAAEAGPEQAEALRIAVISDLNGSYGSTDYRDDVHSAVRWIVDDLEPDAVISTGDMVAGQRGGLDYQAMWRGFNLAVTQPLAEAGIPLAVTPGNHDASAGAAFLDERITYVRQWRRHRPDLRFVDDTFYPMHYAFELGGALFVSLDATLTGPIDKEQLRWLEQVLSEHADMSPKIVFGHVPLFPFSEEREAEILDDTDLEALFDEHGVDLMLSGHHHAYYPGRRGDLRLVGTACLGTGARTLVGHDRRSQKSVAVVEISAAGDISVDAFAAGDHRLIERDGLPEHLNSGRHRIWRDDVADPASHASYDTRK